MLTHWTCFILIFTLYSRWSICWRIPVRQSRGFGTQIGTEVLTRVVRTAWHLVKSAAKAGMQEWKQNIITLVVATSALQRYSNYSSTFRKDAQLHVTSCDVYFKWHFHCWSEGRHWLVWLPWAGAAVLRPGVECVLPSHRRNREDVGSARENKNGWRVSHGQLLSKVSLLLDEAG